MKVFIIVRSKLFSNTHVDIHTASNFPRYKDSLKQCGHHHQGYLAEVSVSAYAICVSFSFSFFFLFVTLFQQDNYIGKVKPNAFREILSM
jgi:hypothetical protein